MCRASPLQDFVCDQRYLQAGGQQNRASIALDKVNFVSPSRGPSRADPRQVRDLLHHCQMVIAAKGRQGLRRCLRHVTDYLVNIGVDTPSALRPLDHAVEALQEVGHAFVNGRAAAGERRARTGGMPSASEGDDMRPVTQHPASRYPSTHEYQALASLWLACTGCV